MISCFCHVGKRFADMAKMEICAASAHLQNHFMPR